MKARTLTLTTVAIAALALPTAGIAKPLHAKAPAKVAKVAKVAKPKANRVLCICVTGAIATVYVQSDDAFKAAYDADLIAHGLDPVYGTTDGSTTSTTDGSATSAS